MPGTRATSSALAIVACAVGLAACGGDEEGGPIPQDAGATLIAQLDQIESAVQEGECDAANEIALAFAAGVNELPPEVTGELRTRLVEASANLEDLSQTECVAPETGATGATGEEPTPTTPTTTTTETTTTDTTTEEPPPDENNGNGPPIEPPGGGNSGGGSGEGDDSSGGIGSEE